MNAEPILALVRILEISRVGVIAGEEIAHTAAALENHQGLASAVSGPKSIEDWAGKLSKGRQANARKQPQRIDSNLNI